MLQEQESTKQSFFGRMDIGVSVSIRLCRERKSMPKGNLTREEIAELIQNPYVEKVVDTRIIYTDEFRQKFIKEYKEGRDAKSIFAGAGFDTNVLGRNRIRAIRNNWRRIYRLDEDYGRKDDSAYREMNIGQLKETINLILADSEGMLQIQCNDNKAGG